MLFFFKIYLEKMKKLLYAFSALALLFASCSGDSDGSSNGSAVLLRKIIATDVSGTMTTDYHYEGNKILDGINSNGSKDVFYYTGNLITKTVFFESGSTTPANEEFITYDSQNRVVETKIYYYYASGNSALKNTYQHNADGTISYERFSGDLNSQNNLVKRGKLFLNATGDVIKVEHYNVSGDLLEKEVYTHDSQNSPFKNVLGFNKLFVYHSMGKWNNIVSYGSYNPANTLTRGYEIDYEFTSANYPSNMIWTYSDGDVLNYQLFY